MLANYGVLRGTLTHTGSHQGQWLHELLYLDVNGAQYECAVDVNEPTLGFQYQILDNLDQTLFTPVLSLPNGYHDLSSQRNASSGALDYARSPILQNRLGCLALWDGLMNAIFKTNQQVWIKVTGDEAGNALAGMVQQTTSLFVFGAPYTSGLGMHDIHCNQGDPVSSQWGPSNGIWQDGAVFAIKPDGSLSAYLGMFLNQTLNTDNNGNPK
jgi:hypothetical protein